MNISESKPFVVRLNVNNILYRFWQNNVCPGQLVYVYILKRRTSLLLGITNINKNVYLVVQTKLLVYAETSKV